MGEEEEKYEHKAYGGKEGIKGREGEREREGRQWETLTPTVCVCGVLLVED